MMRVRTVLFCAGMSLLLSSCEFKCQVGNVKDEPAADDGPNKPVIQNGAAVYNGIQLQWNGVAVTKAYLAYADNGKRISSDNFIEPERGVRIMIENKGGWKEEDGKVFLGASEKLESDQGETILSEEDLFAEKYATGVSAADARYLSLSATVKRKPGEPPASYKMRFRIWDKKGDAVIEGHVTLLTK